MEEIFRTICLAGALQAFFLFIVLLVKKNNRKANRYLSLYLFFGALDACELYLVSRGLIRAPQPYQLSIIPYSLVFGPSVFCYVALLTPRMNKVSKKYLFLFMPFIVAFAVNIILHFVFDASQLPQAVLYVNMIINGGAHLKRAFTILQKYTQRLKEYFSDIDALKLSFFRALLVILVFSIIFIFISYARGNMRHEREIFDVIAILMGLGLVFLIAFLAVMQPEIFNRVRLIENSVPCDETPSSPKYEKFRLSPAKEEEYVKALRDIMLEEKPYLNEELTLQDLADGISLSTHHLSMVLNIHFRQNFYNFINSYRVEDAKEKLKNPDYNDHNILSIAYSAGFNSKTTFNNMFKKITGKTPGEYRAHVSR